MIQTEETEGGLVPRSASSRVDLELARDAGG